MKYKMVDLPKKTRGTTLEMNECGCWVCGKKVSKTNSYMFAQSMGGQVFDVKDPQARNVENGESIGWFEIGSECKNKLPKTHTIKKTDLFKGVK